MSNFIIILILFLFNSLILLAQFPFNIQVNSNGKIISSPPTILNSKYKIIIVGTFSIWPEFNDCHGFDAAYVYDAPQQEIDNYKWPPQEVVVLGNKIEVLKLPKWVGDSTLYKFPPPQISTPVLELSIVKQKGFRINNKPIPNLGYNSLNHKYEFEIIGDGYPLNFQIIDTNFSLQDKINIPRYEDNCGALNIQVIDLTPKDSILTKYLCSTSFESDTSDILHLNLKLFFKKNFNNYESNIIWKSSKINLKLDNVNYNLEYSECQYKRIPSNIVFLLDNSGSMLAGTTKNDSIQRIDESRNIIINLISNLLNSDSIALVCFNDESNIKRKLFSFSNLELVNFEKDIKLVLAGNKTNLINGIDSAINQFSFSNSRNELLVILSDFADNSNLDANIQIVKKLNQINIKSVLINFAQGGNEVDEKSNQFLGNIISSLKNSLLLNSKDTKKIYRVFKEITGQIIDTNCCDLIFKINQCYFGKDTTLIANLEVEYNDSLYKFQQEIDFKCNLKKSIIIAEERIDFKEVNNQIEIEIFSKSQDEVWINVVDLLGNKVINQQKDLFIGKNIFTIEKDKLYKGFFTLFLNFKSSLYTKKFINY